MDTEVLPHHRPVPELAPTDFTNGAIELDTLGGIASPSQIAGGMEEKQDIKHVDVDAQLDNTKRIMNEKFKPFGVEIYSITITNVHLPSQFARQMEDATTFESKNNLQRAEQKFNLQLIEDNEQLNKAQQTMEEMKKSANSSNERLAAQELKTTHVIEAQTQAILAQIREEKNGAVLDISTKGLLEAAQIRKKMEVELAQIEAKSEAEGRRIESESKAYDRQTKARAAALAADLDGQALQVEGAAEAKTGPINIQKRDYEAKMLHLQMLKRLALNKKLVLTGTNANSMIAQLVSSKHSAINVNL